MAPGSDKLLNRHTQAIPVPIQETENRRHVVGMRKAFQIAAMHAGFSISWNSYSCIAANHGGAEPARS